MFIILLIQEKFGLEILFNITSLTLILDNWQILYNGGSCIYKHDLQLPTIIKSDLSIFPEIKTTRKEKRIAVIVLSKIIIGKAPSGKTFTRYFKKTNDSICVRKIVMPNSKQNITPNNFYHLRQNGLQQKAK